MERSYNSFCAIGSNSESSVLFDDVYSEPVFLDIAIGFVGRWRVPSQEYMGRIDSHSTGITWLSTWS